jgi:hypothetical protein
MLNYIPEAEGPAERRPGFEFISSVKTPADGAVRLGRMVISETEAYVLEFGDEYIRFIKNGVLVDDGGSPAATYEVATPYLTAELDGLSFLQTGPEMYIFHENHHPAKLTRITESSWALADVNFGGGALVGPVQTAGPVGVNVASRAVGFRASPPSIDVTTTGISIDNIAEGGLYTAGKVTIVNGTADFAHQVGDKVVVRGLDGAAASVTNGILATVIARNTAAVSSTYITLDIDWTGTDYAPTTGDVYPAIFTADTVDKYFAVKTVERWLYGRVRAFGFEEAIIDLTDPDDLLSPGWSTVTNSKEWRMGIWAEGSYPRFGDFHENRMCIDAGSGRPGAVLGSVPDEYENFETDDAGTPTAASAFEFTPVATEVNQLKWIRSDDKGLITATGSTEFVFSGQGAALSPLNVNVKTNSGYGSEEVSAVRAGDTIVYVQAGGRSIRNMIYSFESEKLAGDDVSRTASHLLQGVVAEVVYQKRPTPVIWARLTDGTLVGCRYESDNGQVSTGFFEVRIAGEQDRITDYALVESLAVIPDDDGEDEQLWVEVKRLTPAGAVARSIERMAPAIPVDGRLAEAVYLDSAWIGGGVEYAMTGTLYKEAVLRWTRSTVGPLVVGQTIFFKTEQVPELNLGLPCEITSITGPVMGVYTVLFSGVDATAFSEWDGDFFTESEAVYRIGATAFTGLTHLASREVTALSDGGEIAELTVASDGSLTLAEPAGWLILGLPYVSQLQLLRFEAGSRTGAALGKLRRIHRVELLLEDTLGIKYGADFNSLYDVPLDQEAQDRKPFSGFKSLEMNSDFDQSNELCFQQDGAMPGTICAVLPRMVLEDAG